jgi:hypothetical protein
MKVATVLVAGERRVGQITNYETSIAPFDLAFAQVRDGILALIRRNGAVAGVGIGSELPKYLKAGDVARIEIGGIGVLANEIVERTT